jgi:hypothetical protein
MIFGNDSSYSCSPWRPSSMNALRDHLTGFDRPVGDLKGGAQIVKRVRHGLRRLGSKHVNRSHWRSPTGTMRGSATRCCYTSCVHRRTERADYSVRLSSFCLGMWRIITRATSRSSSPVPWDAPTQPRGLDCAARPADGTQPGLQRSRQPGPAGRPPAPYARLRPLRHDRRWTGLSARALRWSAISASMSRASPVAIAASIGRSVDNAAWACER